MPQLGYTAKLQRKYELLCGHVKLKGDFKLMVHRKKRPKMVFKKFLRENESILKKLEKKSTKAKPYTREPWMMRSSPIEDEYEEFLRKEAESF